MCIRDRIKGGGSHVSGSVICAPLNDLEVSTILGGTGAMALVGRRSLSGVGVAGPAASAQSTSKEGKEGKEDAELAKRGKHLLK